MLLRRQCVVCGSPSAALCAACLERVEPAGPVEAPEGVDSLSAVLRFDGVGRELVLALKYRNRRRGVSVLAEAMAAAVDVTSIDAVTWAPTSAARRRERGYDQAQLLAVDVARRLGRPCPGLLRRTSTGPQTGLDALHRRLGPSFRSVRPAPARVLLVDDVITTGATLRAAAAALRAGGAAAVIGVTAAATPLKVPG